MSGKAIYQVLSLDSWGSPYCQDWFEELEEAEREMKSFTEMWPGEWWIEEGTEYVKHKCRGCESVYANEMHDAHGITTGYWCNDCYESNKYPYRKDRYPTIETHGYGERLEDDY